MMLVTGRFIRFSSELCSGGDSSPA